LAVLDGIDRGWTQNVASGLSSGEGLIYHVRDPKFGDDDPTVVIDAGVTDKRLLWIESDFSSVLKHFGREHNILSNVLRDAWDGKDVLRTLTKTRPERCRASPRGFRLSDVTG
jgi:putative DNA primase/helicase